MPPSARVLVLAGGADSRATPADARALAAALGDRADVAIIPGGDHLRLAEADPALYRAAVSGLLDQCGQAR